MAHAKSSYTGGMLKLLLILAAVVLLFSLVTWFKTRKSAQHERFSARKRRAAPSRDRFMGSAAGAGEVQVRPMASASAGGGAPAPLETADNELYLPISDQPSGATSPADAFPADRLKPEDLLPKNAANSKWAQANPAGQGDIKDQNFLTAGYHIGFNTQGNSLRNASHDLRSTPANPRYTVSIWQQSTIEPDLSRRPLE